MWEKFGKIHDEFESVFKIFIALQKSINTLEVI